jgi:hypothetical protein
MQESVGLREGEVLLGRAVIQKLETTQDHPHARLVHIARMAPRADPVVLGAVVVLAEVGARPDSGVQIYNLGNWSRRGIRRVVG